MISKFTKEFYEDYRNLSQRHNSFSVYLTLKDYDQVTIEDIKYFSDTFLKPLFNSSDQCVLYKDGDEECITSEILTILKHRGRKYEFLDNIDIDIFTGFECFWGSIGHRRGTILFICDLNKIDFKEILTKTYDPNVLVNAKAIYSPSALKFAKSKVNKNCNKIIIGLPAQEGLTDICFFLSKEMVGDYIELAMNTCILTESYMNLYQMFLKRLNEDPVNRGGR